jgi:amino acid adenylation domain-containing protein
MTYNDIYIFEKAGSIQKKIWIDRNLGRSTDYFTAFQYSFSISLKLDALNEALRRLQKAHEILRTVILLDNNTIKQKIYKEFYLKAEWIQVGSDAIGKYVSSAALEATYRNKDVPAVSYYAFGDSPVEIYSFAILADHCLVDEDSFEIIRLDLELLLNHVDLDYSKRLQYSDYVDWESQAVNRGRTEQTPFKSIMSESTRVISSDIPTIVLRKENQSSKSSGCRKIDVHTISNKHSSTIIKKTQELRSTYFQVFLKILQICLCRWRCAKLSSVASPVTKRIFPEFNNIIGPLLNIECFDHIHDTKLSLNQHLNHLRRDLLSRITPIAFNKANNLFVEQDMSQQQVTPEVFLTVDSRINNSSISNAGDSFVENPLTVQKYPLNLKNKSAGILLLSVLIDEQSERISIQAKYDPELFEQYEIECLINDLEIVAYNLLIHSDDTISSVLVDVGIKLWSKQKKVYSVEESEFLALRPTTGRLLEDFQNLARHQPSQTAIVDRKPNTDQISYIDYASLWNDAEALARYMKHKGVRAGQCVGISLDSLSLFVIACIASWRIGCVYLPLELETAVQNYDLCNEYPQADHWIVSDQIYSHQRFSDNQILVNEGHIELVLKNDQNYCKTDLPTVKDIDAPAYVMYTSGTTGKPKGVLIPSSGILKLSYEFKSRGWNSSTTVLCASNRGFDASTFEIWPTLLNAGTIIRASKNELIDPFQLQSLIKEFQITAAWLTKSVFDLIVQINPNGLLGIKDLFIGGEALTPKFIEKFLLSSGKEIRLWNGYGPTETTTFATIDCLTLNKMNKLNPIYIGKPVFGNTIYVLGPDMELVPTGSVGEVYISGAGVADCYINDPDSTKTFFINDPYSEIPEQRMFRSGDFVQLVSPDKFIFLGRKDNLVKIKGFRVSLQTVKELLLQIDGVSDAAVTIRKVADLDQLVAFVKREQDSTTTATTIRKCLSLQTSNYMIPSLISFVDSIPINRNGKTDYKALAAKIELSINVSCDHTADFELQTLLAKDILVAWKDVLGLKHIDAHSNLYVLGADSLAFVRICILLSKSGVSVTPQDIIGCPCVNDQIRVIHELAASQSKARIKRFGLSSYQLILKDFLSKQPNKHSLLFTSFLVDIEYDAIAVGIAMFRITSLHPTISRDMIRKNIDDDLTESPVPISIVRLSDFSDFTTLERSVASTTANELSGNNTSIRVYVAHGSKNNLFIIGISNLNCSIQKLSAMRKKLSCWLKDRNSSSWSWSLDSLDLSYSKQNTVIAKKKGDIKSLVSSLQNYSLEDYQPNFNIAEASKIICDIIQKSVLELGQTLVRNILIVTDGIINSDSYNRVSTQPSRVIKIASYHELASLSIEELEIFVASRIIDDASELTAFASNNLDDEFSAKSTDHVQIGWKDLLIVVERIECIYRIGNINWKELISTASTLYVAAISIINRKIYVSISETFPFGSSQQFRVLKPSSIDSNLDLIGIIKDFNSTKNQPKVMCVSPLIGDISCYRSLANASTEQLSLSALYINNTQHFPSSKTYIEEITDIVCDVLIQDPPDVILGYSFGGVLAASVASKLFLTHEVLPNLVIIDTINPYTLKNGGYKYPEYDLYSWMNRVLDLKVKLSGITQLGIPRPKSLDSCSDLLLTIQSLIEYGLMPAGSSEMSFYAYLKHGLEQFKAYIEFRPPILYNSTLIVSASDQEKEVVNALSSSSNLSTLGWSNYLAGKKEVIYATGDHLDMVHGCAAPQIARLIVDSINQLHNN